MSIPTFCDMIHLKELNQHTECYKLEGVKYVYRTDVIECFNITETRYRLLVRDGYLTVLKDFVTLDSFSYLLKVCKLYTSNENNIRVTHFPPLIWLKNKYRGIK